MSYLIKAAHIVDPASPHHHSVTSILIENGLIKAIGDNLSAPDAVVLAEEVHVSPGWVDLYAHFCDPGEEHKEDLHSGAQAAMKGGFTGVLIRPDTHPAIDSKSDIEYIRRTHGLPVEIWPSGALTRSCAGKEPAELYDLHQSGAVAFGNGEIPLAQGGMLLRALQYVLPFKGVVLYRPHKSSLGDGPVHESAMSVRLGLKGSPSMSEEMAVREAIELAQYTQSHLHLVKVSTAGSVALIKAAKANGTPVTASVSAAHLLWEEDKLETFDELYKLSPPLRSAADRAALIQGVIDGVIDVIVSDHMPQDDEAKKVEFEYAAPGIASLPATFHMAWQALQPHTDIDTLVAAMAIRPRQLLGRPAATIQVGATANLTIFRPREETLFTQDNWAGKSINYPLMQQTLPGRVVATVLGNLINQN